MSEHENEDSSSESELSEDRNPQIKVNEQILRTIQEIRECRAKKLKLMTSQTTDAPVPESDLKSSHKELRNTMTEKLIHKELLQSCFMSDALIESLMSKKYSEHTNAGRIILHHLTVIANHESNSLKLLEEQTAILQERVELTLKYKKNLQNYRELVEEHQVKTAERLQTTNPELAKELRSINPRIKKINIMNRTIMNMYAGAVHLINDSDDLRELLREHMDNVRLEDFEQTEQEP